MAQLDSTRGEGHTAERETKKEIQQSFDLTKVLWWYPQFVKQRAMSRLAYRNEPYQKE